MFNKKQPTRNSITYVIICGLVATPLTQLPHNLDNVTIYCYEAEAFLQGKVEWDFGASAYRFAPFM
jgi:hypothetical protein